jgi:Zinc carboxypeptidase
MKKIFLFVAATLCGLVSFAQLQSPQQYLGYALGEQFTTTHQIYHYAEHVAQQVPSKVKVINYGKTYERRGLMAVVVASEENLKNIEQLRTDHLKSIGMMSGQPAQKTRPPFLWMSYNVHGNEAVNSEASMKVLHELLSTPAGEKILKNAVVILAPCLNPDGHDRYVNWYNQKIGRLPNPNPSAWEHAEPWPGGRYTHYLFDPNRDWAWQTQEITRQLITLYHQWMPQLHGDFHEMGPESHYYFAPSAKPYHEDITPWQREMQEVVGSYNKKYFDRNNWLYYTRERFDLLYPSYGDTWPTYNGAIAMTYEQGGSGVAGLAYDRPSEGDTLTLRDRIAHVAGASMATFEAAADRPDKIVEEFLKFYDRAQNNPIGIFKSYVIKTAGEDGKTKAFKELLDRNQIRYGYATDVKAFKGLNYLSQKDEDFKTEAGDLIISAYQPKSTLLKILFETKPMLEDSLTYDITSWCVPLAFGLKTYGVKERLTGQQSLVEPKISNLKPQISNPYAYLINWKSAEEAKLLAALMQQKIRVRAAEKPFEIGGKSYGAGTLIVTRAGNEALGSRFDQIIQAEAARLGVALYTTESGGSTKGSDFGSDYVYPLKHAPRVGLLAGEGTSMTTVGEVWHFFDQELKYPLTVIDANIRGGSMLNLSKLDVLVVPTSFGGNLLRESQMPALREWLRGGGRLILLENANNLLADKDGFELKTKKDDKKADRKMTDSLRVYANRERDAAMDDSPGSIYKLKLDNTHPLAFGFPDYYYALVNNAYNFDFLKNGWNVGYVKKEKEAYVAGFTGKNVKDKLQNTLFFGVEDMGRGKVVHLTADPLFRGFWYNGKLLFANAVFMLP